MIFSSETAATVSIVILLERHPGGTLQGKLEQRECNSLTYARFPCIASRIENFNFFFATEQPSIKSNLQAFLVLFESACLGKKF